MRKDTPVREWINNFNEGKYQSNDCQLPND